MRLFVSYSSKDSTSVKTLIRDLEEAARHAIWADQELTGGEIWWQEILQQIRQCDVFVLALSNNSLRSKPCLAELSYAQALGLPVVPVQIGPVDSPRLVPVSQIQIIDYRNPTATVAISLVTALQDGAARRGELPDPLPEPPPIPYEYLLRLSIQIDSPVLPHTDQLAIVAQLRESLDIEDDSGVRADLSALLRKLRSRSDVTFRVASEIDAILGQYDGHAAPGNATLPSRSTAAPQHPQDHPPQTPARQPGWPPPARFTTNAPQQAQQQGPPSPPTVQPVSSQPAQPAGRKFAIWGIALGIAGLIPFLGLLPGLAGIVCALVAKSRKQPLAKAALVISLTGTALGLVILILR